MVAQIRRMQIWVIETERILAGDWAKKDEVLTNKAVAERFDAWLATLQAQLDSGASITELEKECLAHFIKVSVSLRPRLIHCYDEPRSEEHTSELQSHSDLVCRL